MSRTWRTLRITRWKLPKRRFSRPGYGRTNHRRVEAKIQTLKRLETLALAVRRTGHDTKWRELAKLLSENFHAGRRLPTELAEEGGHYDAGTIEPPKPSPSQKLVVFTVHTGTRSKSEEEIAAAFFVSVAVVRQRLRLAAVSPKLLDVYAEDGMTLTSSWRSPSTPTMPARSRCGRRLQRSYTKEPHQIRRMLTEGAVRASDKRAQFVGVEAYEAAGGLILRDLFNSDDGGWLQDPALLDRLVTEKLDREAEAIRAEGWKWVEVAPDFPYGHTYDLRRLVGEQRPLAEDETAAHDALRAEFDRLEESYAEANEIPEEVDQRLSEIETALAAFEERPVVYDPAEIGRAGAFVSIDGSGAFGSSAAMSGPRTSRRSCRPTTARLMARRTRLGPARHPVRTTTPRLQWVGRPSRPSRPKRTRACGRSPTGLSPSSPRTARWRCAMRLRTIRTSPSSRRCTCCA